MALKWTAILIGALDRKSNAAVSFADARRALTRELFLRHKSHVVVVGLSLCGADGDTLHSAAELRQKARESLARSAVNRIREDPDSD
jgi:hypothetical protein